MVPFLITWFQARMGERTEDEILYRATSLCDAGMIVIDVLRALSCESVGLGHAPAHHRTLASGRARERHCAMNQDTSEITGNRIDHVCVRESMMIGTRLDVTTIRVTTGGGKTTAIEPRRRGEEMATPTGRHTPRHHRHGTSATIAHRRGVAIVSARLGWSITLPENRGWRSTERPSMHGIMRQTTKVPRPVGVSKGRSNRGGSNSDSGPCQARASAISR